MAKQPPTSRRARGGEADEPFARSGPPSTTGRYLVLLRKDALEEGARLLARVTGRRPFRTAGAGHAEAAQLEGPGPVVFDALGVAVMALDEAQLRELQGIAEADSPILAIEPERVVEALADVPADAPVARPLQPKGSAPGDESEATWGLQATRVLKSKYSGKGIKVAILDSGIDLLHPELAGRQIVGKSFVFNQDVQDQLGHGTHCAGTACGPKVAGSRPRYGRYGIACDATIYAGKVLSNKGNGTDGWIIAGMEWATTNGCRVVSMSLGGVLASGKYSRVFEAVAQRGLAAGTVMMAAAGNSSARRRGKLASVEHPANCPSILAIAAVDWNLDVADFSNAGLAPDGGQVDIAAPGVRVHSMWPGRIFKRLSGTSMATPHAAGVLALLAEAHPQASGAQLVELLTRSALRLRLSPQDVGAGLVQAP